MSCPKPAYDESHARINRNEWQNLSQSMQRFTILIACGFAWLNANYAFATDPARPNILWITSEDNGPQLGCYGDSYATTPNLDRLAARGMIYRKCWSNAPVCAPART